VLIPALLMKDQTLLGAAKLVDDKFLLEEQVNIRIIFMVS